MHVAFLCFIEVAVADIIDKTVEKPADAGRELFPGKRLFQFLSAKLQLGGRIDSSNDMIFRVLFITPAP